MVLKGLVLAGGKSERMGQDKGELVIAGKSMLMHCLDALANQTDSTAVIYASAAKARADRNVLSRERVSVINDRPMMNDSGRNIGGPLLAIASGLEFLFKETDVTQQSLLWVLTLPCDTPFFPKHFLTLLRRHADLHSLLENNNLIYLNDGDNDHYAISLWRASSYPAIYEHLKKGRYSIKSFIASTKAGVIDTCGIEGFSQHALMNINTPDDVKKAQRFAKED